MLSASREMVPDDESPHYLSHSARTCSARQHIHGLVVSLSIYGSEVCLGNEYVDRDSAQTNQLPAELPCNSKHLTCSPAWRTHSNNLSQQRAVQPKVCQFGNFPRLPPLYRLRLFSAIFRLLSLRHPHPGTMQRSWFHQLLPPA